MKLPLIENVYDDFTNVERGIADFFLTNNEDMDYTSRIIAKKLFVSEASLSRFAKKCGFQGFREFLFYYKDMVKQSKNIGDCPYQSIIGEYKELLLQSEDMVQEEQLNRIIKKLTECKKVFVYGMGSSGFAAKEFQLRFMRLGLWVEAVTDVHMMKINSVLADSDTAVIGITLSGKTAEVLDTLELAKKKKGYTILFTANKAKNLKEKADETIYLAKMKNLEYGMSVSPQLPSLIFIDIIFSYFLRMDWSEKAAIHSDTVSALFGEKNKKDL